MLRASTVGSTERSDTTSDQRARLVDQHSRWTSRGFGRPMFQVLAFPGEEPPSIECNEDAGQEFTDE
jgi:hypothetical protein